MTDRPETYALSSEEWSAINRALAGARLELRRWKCSVSRKMRLARVRTAQEILAAAYERASESGQRERDK